MIVAVLLVFAAGIGAGLTLAAPLAEYYANTETGRRRHALRLAEDRIRAAQTRALNLMADAAALAVVDGTTGMPTERPTQPATRDLLAEHEERS